MIILMAHCGRRRSSSWRPSWNTCCQPTMPMILVGGSPASADSGSLERYLKTFDQTIAVMQTAANLRRVAAEYVADLAADGVIYGETRWAPEQHLSAGLTAPQAIEAVRDGLADGMAAVERAGRRSR